MNTYKNVESSTVGRILSYYDLCDIPYGHDAVDKDLDFSEFMTEEEKEESEVKKREREEEERRRREEEEWLEKEEEKRRKEEAELAERKAQVRIKEEERRAERDSGKPREASELFREINRKRKSSRPRSAQGNQSNDIIIQKFENNC